MSAIDLDDLIDKLEDVLAEGQRVPFINRLLIDEERMLDIIDRMRIALPEEIKQARRIVQEQQNLLAEARARLEGHELQQAAEEAYQVIVQQAEEEAASVRVGADDYARSVLEGLDDQLLKLLTNVRNGLDSLDGAAEEPQNRVS